MPDPQPQAPRLSAHLPSDEDPTVTRCGAPWEPWKPGGAQYEPCPVCHAEPAEEPPA